MNQIVESEDTGEAMGQPLSQRLLVHQRAR